MRSHPVTIIPLAPARRRLVLIAVLSLVACGTTSISFTATKDDSLIDELQSSWESSDQDVVQLALCEDRQRSDSWADPGGCQVAHVVRGGERSIEHKEQEPSGVGCGGCPFEVLAYVKGTIQGGPFSEPAELVGSVNLGDLYEVDKIFHYPYHVYLSCTGDTPACSSVNGELYEDGHLELEILKDVNSQYIKLTLSSLEAYACDAID